VLISDTHDFKLADQDWSGLTIFKNFADQGWIGFNFIGQDWTRTEKFHSPLISAVQYNTEARRSEELRPKSAREADWTIHDYLRYHR